MTTDITKLANEWRDYRGDYSDDELTEYGKTRADVYDELADQLEAALPVWIKLEKGCEMPKHNAPILVCSARGIVDYRGRTSELSRGWLVRSGFTHWRYLCDLDHPLEDMK